MAQITIEIPDEIASRLSPYQERLPALISRWVSVLEVSPSSSVELPSQSDSQVYQDIISFLLSQPDPQAILSFKVSEEAQVRLSVLLDKTRSGELNAGEVAELDLYEQLDQTMRMLKLQAFSILKDKGQASSVLSD